jgi:hypothetical protein
MLITFGDLSLREVMADRIAFDRKPMGSNFGVFTIRFVEETPLSQHHIVVDRDCNFVVRSPS